MREWKCVDEWRRLEASSRGVARAARSPRTYVAWLGLALSCFALACAPVPRPGQIEPPSGPPRTAGPTFHVDEEPRLDVGLAWDLDSLTVTPRQPVSATGEGSRAEEFVDETRQALSVRPDERGWQVTWSGPDGEPRGAPIAPAETLWIGPPGHRSGGTEADASLAWAGKTWRGRFKIFVNARRRLTLAVRLPLETYLLGVVPGEIGGLSEELLQAGRAQAIAARSYTLFYRGRRASEGFDLFGSVEDQVYGPIESERPLATRCVLTTRGQVALAQGAPIRANYCSTCGGITAEVWEAWPAAPLSYLVSHRDAGPAKDNCAQSAAYRWREEWTAAEFLGLIARYAPQESIPVPASGMGELLDVRVEARSRSGRVWLLVVETTTGRVELPAYSLRRVLRRPGGGAQILRSNLFKIDLRRDPVTRSAIAVVASGAGSGHGVGLCQTGAIGMARTGAKAEGILAQYYPGAELRRLY